MTELHPNSASFFKRFYTYQKERFPILGHGILVASFSFSAVSYSRICRGEDGFIPWHVFLVGIFTTIGLFFLVRVFDEFKDKEEDALHRKYLPVPRGLISLKELAVVGSIVLIVQVVLNLLFFPKMLLIYGVVFGYLLLMGKEFFIADWLKKHHFWYVVSHMLIIPLVDVYASGLDWLLENTAAPFGLVFFFAVSFMNGIVLEIGRKIKTPENEELNTYSTKLGAKNATFLWIFALVATLVLSLLAAWYAHLGVFAYSILGALFILCCIPGILFLKNRNARFSKLIETSSIVWTIAMYLTLGGIPMLVQFIYGT